MNVSKRTRGGETPNCLQWSRSLFKATSKRFDFVLCSLRRGVSKDNGNSSSGARSAAWESIDSGAGIVTESCTCRYSIKTPTRHLKRAVKLEGAACVALTVPRFGIWLELILWHCFTWAPNERRRLAIEREMLPSLDRLCAAQTHRPCKIRQ